MWLVCDNATPWHTSSIHHETMSIFEHKKYWLSIPLCSIFAHLAPARDAHAIYNNVYWSHSPHPLHESHLPQFCPKKACSFEKITIFTLIFGQKHQKTHFFVIFLQKYLVEWKKSSTFAPAFGKRALSCTVREKVTVVTARIAKLETYRRYYGRVHRKTAGLTNY